METSLIAPLVIFITLLLVMFYFYYCAQQRIKRIENDHHVDNDNKGIEGAARCSLLRCNCRICRYTNRSGTNLTTSGSPETAQENVWSVSREINAVYGPPPNYQWPTHNQHISMNSFSLTGAHQTIGSPPSTPASDTGGTKITPPPYSEVELPTYEEAITAEYQNHTYETIPSTGRTQIS